MSKNYSNPFSATLQGIVNLFQRQESIGTLGDNERIDGLTCLVTGANSGLGFAIASQLAARGGKVIMACRSGIPEAGEAIRKATGSAHISMVPVDLSDILSIHRLCGHLAAEGVKLDIVVCNAGVVPARARRTKQGFEEMFAVNYLAKFVLLTSLWERGFFNFDGERQPRVVVVSSESHRSGMQINIDELGVYSDFKMGKVVGLYGYYKLLLNTMITHLSTSWNSPGGIRIGIHLICPGAVNSNIAKEAPRIFKPLIKLIFGLFFQDPAKAARPVLYLCCSPEIENRNGIYLHMNTPKQMDSRATDPEMGQALVIKTEELVKPYYQAGSLS